MLVFISDLHLTDGTSGETIKAGAFRVFRERLRDLAYDASWRADGKYRPIERLDIVLLGDVLDVIRSSQWLSGKLRPWDDWKDPAFATKVSDITDAILGQEENLKSIECLNQLHDATIFTIPKATKDGKPEKVGRDPDAQGRQQVIVNIHYVVGNHDWFFHLSGGAYNIIRNKIVERMGLANDPDQPFPHDTTASAVLSDVCRAHQVFGRHGDVFDGFNFEGTRDASSLGDAIVVELLNRFPLEVANHTFTPPLPPICQEGLKEIDNIRPLLTVPAWIEGLLRRTCPNPHVAQQVKDVWNGLVNKFLAIPFVKSHDKWYKLDDLVDKLGWSLRLSKGVSLRDLSRVLTWWSERTGERDGGFYKNALAEQVFRDRSVRHMVYGHTHHHEIVPLDSSGASGASLDQMYLNAGTWRRVHELAKWEPKEEEFMSYEVMSYLAFFKDGERGGRAFESWSGVLGV